MADTPENQDQTAQELDWQKTLQRLGLGDVDIRDVRASDIVWLAKHWQFLQVVESSGNQASLAEPEQIIAASGWTILNYGNAMSTSPGKFIFGFGSRDEDDDGSGGVNPGKGTIIKQAFDSACEIIQLAKKAGWAGVQIIDGHPNMQEAAWVEACRIGVKLDGYTPDVDAEKKRRRIVSETIDEMQQALRSQR